MKEQPSYYSIIPANVRYDCDLSPNAKLLYAEISSLTNKDGFCWASNDYFSKLYGVSKTSISKWVSQLIEKKYVKSQIIYKEGTKQILNRYLTIVNDPIEEKLNTPIEEKLKDNNTSINNKKNIKYYSEHIFITQIIKEMESIDIKNKLYYNNHTQKQACDFLIREYGLDKVIQMIQTLPKIKNIPYMPSVTTPCELRDKWQKVIDAVHRERNKQKGGEVLFT